jgi:hypothetical protein
MTDTEIREASREHVLRVLVEERMHIALRDIEWYEGRMGKVGELPTYESALASFQQWYALRSEAYEVAEVLRKLLVTAGFEEPEQADPITAAKAEADRNVVPVNEADRRTLAEMGIGWSEGELREAWGR